MKNRIGIISRNKKLLNQKIMEYTLSELPEKTNRIVLDDENMNANKDYCINPLDIVCLSFDEPDLVYSLQFDFIVELIEMIIKDNLAAYQKSILDKILKDLYRPYFEHLNENLLYIDYSKVPVLADLYNCLKESELDIDYSNFEYYINNPLFNGHTNISIDDITKINCSSSIEALIGIHFAFTCIKLNYNGNIRTEFIISNLHPDFCGYYFTIIYKRLRPLGCSSVIGISDETFLKSEDCKIILNLTNEIYAEDVSHDCQTFLNEYIIDYKKF